MSQLDDLRAERQTELDAIREGVRAVVSRFDDEYWLERDEDGKFPFEFHRAMAEGGWLGITMPEEYGGSGLGVTEAAIIGVPHDRLGEEVGAVVRVREGSTLSVDDVRAHVGARLAGFKVPTHVWISTDELPRNATGKVLKRQLRDALVREA